MQAAALQGGPSGRPTAQEQVGGGESVDGSEGHRRWVPPGCRMPRSPLWLAGLKLRDEKWWFTVTVTVTGGDTGGNPSG